MSLVQIFGLYKGNLCDDLASVNSALLATSECMHDMWDCGPDVVRILLKPNVHTVFDLLCDSFQRFDLLCAASLIEACLSTFCMLINGVLFTDRL